MPRVHIGDVNITVERNTGVDDLLHSYKPAGYII